MDEFELLFITSESGTGDKAMVIVEKGLDKKQQNKVLKMAVAMGIDEPVVEHRIPVSADIAETMNVQRVYVG